MKLVLKSVLVICAVTSAAGLRRNSKTQSDAVVNGEVDCTKLANLTFGGKNFGPASQLLCQFWPSKRGDFPVDVVSKVGELVEQAMGRGGLWDKLKKVSQERGERSSFCWSDFQMRNVNANSDRCEAEHKGVCYGACPYGFQKTRLLKFFKPVCQSFCPDTDHPRGCGFGCAKDLGTCAKVVMEQINLIAKALSAAADYMKDDDKLYSVGMAGSQPISDITGKTLKLVEFFVQTLWNLVKEAKKLWKEESNENKIVAFATVFVTFIIQQGKEFGQNIDMVKKNFGQITELWLEISEAEFSWRKLDVSFLSKTLVRHGSTILDSAFEVTKAFVYPKCSPGDKASAIERMPHLLADEDVEPLA